MSLRRPVQIYTDPVTNVAAGVMALFLIVVGCAMLRHPDSQGLGGVCLLLAGIYLGLIVPGILGRRIEA